MLSEPNGTFLRALSIAHFERILVLQTVRYSFSWNEAYTIRGMMPDAETALAMLSLEAATALVFAAGFLLGCLLTPPTDEIYLVPEGNGRFLELVHLPSQPWCDVCVSCKSRADAQRPLDLSEEGRTSPSTQRDYGMGLVDLRARLQAKQL